MFRNVLEGTFRAIFFAAVALNLDLVAVLCARTPVVLPRQDLLTASP